MTKTPDEIKKGLECCGASIYQCADDCPYRDECRIGQGGKAMMEDALALIQKLEAERDAAVSDIARGSRCSVCKKFFKNGGECSGGVYCIPLDFEWRGVQKD